MAVSTRASRAPSPSCTRSGSAGGEAYRQRWRIKTVSPSPGHGTRPCWLTNLYHIVCTDRRSAWSTPARQGPEVPARVSTFYGHLVSPSLPPPSWFNHPMQPGLPAVHGAPLEAGALPVAGVRLEVPRFAQFIAVCSSSILAKTLGYAVAFSSPWRGKRRVVE